jgi:hypothetical protein
MASISDILPTTTQQQIIFELCTDNTGSMGQACTASKTSASEIRALTSLAMGCPSVKFGVVGDYDKSTPNFEIGGCVTTPPDADNDTFNDFLEKHMKPCGGGGAPEAYITYLNRMLCSELVPNVLFLFLDALPHGYEGRLDNEGNLELAYITANGMSQDWNVVCDTVKSRGIHVVTFLTANSQKLRECYTKLGDVVVVQSNRSEVITKTMLSVFYGLVGQSQNDDITYYYLDQGSKIVSRTKIEPLCQVDFMRKFQTADIGFVIETFRRLINPTISQSIMCLTTNPILGKYWRAICGKYRFVDDGRFETQCKEIMDKLSQCSARLTGTDAITFKKWIDESHNDSPIIHNKIKSAYDGCPTFIIPQEMKASLSLDDILALGRDGKFFEVSKVIATIQLTKDVQDLSESEDESPNFLPITLSNKDLFSLIGNLLSPGLILPMATSLMIAILSLNNRFLGERAFAFLMEHKGAWIKWDQDQTGEQLFPAFWSVNFFQLLKLVPEPLLTTQEQEFRDHFLTVMRVTRNHDAKLQIVCPYMSQKLPSDVTWKQFCDPANGGCGHERCFTTFPGDSQVCGICISLQDPAIKKEAENYRHKTDAREICEKNKDTHWAQCWTCKSNYSVTTIDQLKVRAKCHDCRFGNKPQIVECVECLGKYLSPGGSAILAMRRYMSSLHESPELQERLALADSNGDFICPRCLVHPDTMKMEVDVKISALIDENPNLQTIIPFTPYATLVDKKTKLWKRVLQVKYEPKEMTIDKLKYNGFTIHTPEMVAKSTVDTLLNHDGFASCGMCASDVPVREMVPWCGYCPNHGCRRCIDAVYGQFKMGTVVSQSIVSCPFCKSAPKYNVVRNMQLRHVRNLRPTRQNKGEICTWEPREIYASCIRCLCIKPALSRECAQEVPRLDNWICTDCVSAQPVSTDKVSEIAGKHCPQCDAFTEHIGGCHHMSCPCGSHWCWVCRGQFTSEEIYDHMAGCGGIFPRNAGDDDDYDDYDY